MPRRFDPFQILPDAEREHQLDRLERVLQDRDGHLDLRNLHLEKREEWIRPLEAASPLWKGQLVRDGFRRAFYGRQRTDLDLRAAWLVALARSNESESFGVRLDHQRFMNGSYADPSWIQQAVLVEERYHGRILRAACRVFGVDLQDPRPRWSMRVFIRAANRLPEALRYVPILCGEAMGTIVFARLRDTVDLFDEQPDVREHLHALLAPIAVDEVLHVVYCRARMAPPALRAARRIAPAVVEGLLRQVPELRRLGLDRREILRNLRRGIEIPENCDWIAAEGHAPAWRVAAPV